MSSNNQRTESFCSVWYWLPLIRTIIFYVVAYSMKWLIWLKFVVVNGQKRFGWCGCGYGYGYKQMGESSFQVHRISATDISRCCVHNASIYLNVVTSLEKWGGMVYSLSFSIKLTEFKIIYNFGVEDTTCLSYKTLRTFLPNMFEIYKAIELPN